MLEQAQRIGLAREPRVTSPPASTSATGDLSANRPPASSSTSTHAAHAATAERADDAIATDPRSGLELGSTPTSYRSSRGAYWIE